jgi:hypothetical protein
MFNCQIEPDQSNSGHWMRNMFGSSGAENLVINLDPGTEKYTYSNFLPVTVLLIYQNEI